MKWTTPYAILAMDFTDHQINWMISSDSVYGL
jgi:hypothetical protein